MSDKQEESSGEIQQIRSEDDNQEGRMADDRGSESSIDNDLTL
jgi:hypothetical protein